MHKSGHIRDLQDWYDQWDHINISKDTMQKLQRGPLKDFQSFLIRHAKTGQFIETMRTNTYVNSGKMDDSIKKEVSDTMFADKQKIVQQLDDELNTRRLQCDKKRETLGKKQKKHIQDKLSSASMKKGKLYKLLNQRIEETTALLQDLESLSSFSRDDLSSETTTTTTTTCISSSVAESKELMRKKKDKECLEALSQEAHLAFQSVVLGHYLKLTDSPSTSMASHYGNISINHSNVSASVTTAEHFNLLVSQVVVKSSNVASFVNEQLMSHLQTCLEQKTMLELENQSTSPSHNISAKINDIAISWSRDHVEAHRKNKIREKQVKEAENVVAMKQKQAIANANGCRLSDLLTVIRKEHLGAQIMRVRQYASRTPIQCIFKNISSDSFRSSMIASNENLNILLDHHGNEIKNKIQPWILAISNSEHLEDIFIALQKTWPVAKRNLFDMISFSRETDDFLPNVLQTAELLKISLPRTHRCIENTVNSRPTDSTHHNFQLNTTFGSSTTTLPVESSQRFDDISVLSSIATTTVLTNNNTSSCSLAADWDEPINISHKSHDDSLELFEAVASINSRRSHNDSKIDEFQKLLADLHKNTW